MALRRPRPRAALPFATVPPSVLVLTGIVSVQCGAGLAARLFAVVPPAAVTGLRLWAAAMVLAAVGARGLARALASLARQRSWRDAAVTVAFGLTLAAMNYSIYQAFARIPLGIAVTVEFLGPLAVSVASSRRMLDLLWVTLAGTGVALLTRAGDAPTRHTGLTFATGLGFAAAAGTAWACYILLSRATGRRFPGTSGLTIAMIVAAAVITPVGAAAGGAALLQPRVAVTGLAIGLLSSIIPYSLEMEALRRVPARVFGIWMSLEPAVAALVGLVLLGQALAVREWAAIMCVMTACAGAARGSTTPEGPAVLRGVCHGSASGAGAGRAPARAHASHIPGIRPYHGCVPAHSTPATPPDPGRPHPERTPPRRVARAWAALRRFAAPVTHPTPVSMRRLALASVIANAGILSTGAAVRLSNSGLGCLDWPKCTQTSLAAAPRPGEPMIHTWVEFGNRTLFGVVEVAAVLVLVAALRFRPPGSGYRRRDLVALAALQPIAVLAQAVVGGIVVLTGLNPAWVSGHFVLSVAVVAAAVTLHARCTEGVAPATPLVRRELQMLAAGVIAVVLAMLVAGTVVTGTGPLAGAPGVQRYHLQLQGVTQFHADIGWLMGGVAFALVLGLRLTGAPGRIIQTGYVLLGLMAAQGLIGYVQYFSHLPAGLVWVHESSSILIWITALRLWFALRERGTIASPDRLASAPATQQATSPAPAG